MLSPFGFQAVFTQWQSAPVVTGGVILAAALYLWGVIRVARRHPARPWPKLANRHVPRRPRRSSPRPPERHRHL